MQKETEETIGFVVNVFIIGGILIGGAGLLATPMSFAVLLLIGKCINYDKK